MALRIDLFSDVVCPWCFIGSERLDKVLAERAGEPAEVVHHAFLLRPDAPEEGLDIPEMLRSKYGADPKQMFARVEAAAAESGLALDLSKQPRMYPTVAAHTLLRHAAARGTQHALARALFDAYFHQAKRINDPAVLAELAAPHGFGADEVRRLLADPGEREETLREAQEASAEGIRGVPFFVFNGKLAVSGAQSEDVLREAIRRAS